MENETNPEIEQTGVNPQVGVQEAKNANPAAFGTLVEVLNETRSMAEKNSAGLEKVGLALAEALNEFKETVAGVRAEKVADVEAERELSAEEFVKRAGEATNKETRNLLLDKAASLIGDEKTRVLQSGDNYIRSIMFTPSRRVHGTASAEDTLQLQRANDHLVVIMAEKGLISSGTLEGHVETRSQGSVAVEEQKVANFLNNVVENSKGAFTEYEVRAAKGMLHYRVQTTTGVGTGAETLPQPLSSSFVDEVYGNLAVANLFQRIPMTTRTLRIPAIRGGATAFRATEANSSARIFQLAVAESTIPTDDIDFVAQTLGVLTTMSYEFDEDTALPFAQIQLEKMRRAMAVALESSLINGSTLLTDLDNTPANGNRLWNNTGGGPFTYPEQGNYQSVDFRNTVDGLRKLALAKSGNTIDVNNDRADILVSLKLLHAKMGGSFGGQTDQWVAVLPFVAHALATVSDPNFITIDKYGPRATVATGEIGQAYGIPLLISDEIPTYLAATGVYNPTVDRAKTIGMLVHRGAFAIGNRVGAEYFSGTAPLGMINYRAARMRYDFRQLYATADKTVGLLLNVPTTH
jgi:hypothetical protein